MIPFLTSSNVWWVRFSPLNVWDGARYLVNGSSQVAFHSISLLSFNSSVISCNCSATLDKSPGRLSRERAICSKPFIDCNKRPASYTRKTTNGIRKMRSGGTLWESCRSASSSGRHEQRKTARRGVNPHPATASKNPCAKPRARGGRAGRKAETSQTRPSFSTPACVRGAGRI